MLQNFVLVVLVVRRKRLIDLVMIEQNGGSAGVFAQHYISRLDDLNGPEGYIGQVADGGWNNVEHKASPSFPLLSERDATVLHS